MSQTDIYRLKRITDARSGSKHWWHERFSSIILLIVSLWLFVFLKNIYGKDYLNFAVELSKPHNIIISIIFVLTSLYHSMLGMQVIVEDYIVHKGIQLLLIILLQSFCFISAISYIVAMFYLVGS